MKNCLLKSENLTIGYQDNILINNACIECREGEVVLIIGVNGSGKTSLLNVLSGHSDQEVGDVFFKNINIKNINIKSKAKFCSYLPQFIEKLNDLLVSDYLDMGITNSHLEIEKILDQIDIKEIYNKRMGQLSGGELKKIAFYSSLKSNPSLLFLDEPLQNLDPKTKFIFAKAIKEFSKLGKTVVMTSHDFLWATNISNRVYGVSDNKLSLGALNPEFFSKIMKYPFIELDGSIIPQTMIENV